jgi:hypothetical protein
MDRTWLTRYDPQRGPKSLGHMWTATKDAVDLTCVLFTHQEGWELRLEGFEGIARSTVCATADDVLTTAEAWRTEAEAKGWRD